MSKRDLDHRSDYDPDGGWWDYNLDMFIKYEDMGLL